MEITLRAKYGDRTDAEYVRGRIEQACDFLGIEERSVMIHDADGDEKHARDVLTLAHELHRVRCGGGCKFGPGVVDFEKARRALRRVIA